MDYQNLLVDYTDGIALVTLNRPKALNALNQQILEELRHFFEQRVLQLDGLKGIILTGAGDKAFVAGADIKEFLDLNSDAAESMAHRGHQLFFRIERLRVPVIAAIEGFALGGGCELAMACHLRIASEKARFGQPEVNLGIIPGYGGTQRLTQLIGKGKALELMMTADMIGAEEAHRLGLVNHVVAPGESVAKAREIIRKVATKAPIAITKVIESVNAYYDHDQDGYLAEAKAFGASAGTADFKEGAAAFIEKRKADFKGQ